MEASNVKAMREALETICDMATPRAAFGDSALIDRIFVEAARALAAPPRNCDRPECQTTREAARVWRLEDGGKTAYHEWLLAPSTERKEENDGSK